ncbi:curli production assembly/transport component CsgF [Hymenobacter jejuensis]|uniref:Curli production assembly/transport component CsgF n=1 Tax=Hymenobacter jejuensis TaxID=2502781 RepID=A0A5B7ZZE1_9BACT|nr:curli production assembly/transport component CsgF [Hymenobacter jejuensis]QDA60217.1 curli production assembly/transport component CsgF [Hymenobacter jejuensis]
MKANLLHGALVMSVLAISAHSAAAQDFTYKAKNPAFGGDTFNYQWLQSSAQAQNSTKDPAAASATAGFQQDPLKQFQDNLNQQLLGQLAQKLVGNQFGAGNEPLKAGNYNVGSYQIGVTPNGGGFSIRITDTSTGNQTTITIPAI